MAAHPTPDRFFDMLSGIQRTAVLRTAVELGICDAIAGGAVTAAAIAARAGASEKGVRILCDYLCTVGLLEKAAAGYSLSGEAAFFLVSSSPAYLGGTIRFLLGDAIRAGYDNLTQAVRQGSTALAAGSMAPEHPMWCDFALAMVPMMMPAAMFMAGAVHRDGPCKILDVAAGHGIFGIKLAQRNPEARVVACDWAAVLEVARENAQAAGVADRWTALPGSIFEVDPGGGYDLILLTNFLHHFSPSTNETLLRKVHGQLAPGGRCVTLEFVPNADRISPPQAAQFAAVMLATTGEGDAYPFAEYEAMFAAAGFASSEHVISPGFPGSLIVSSL